LSEEKSLSEQERHFVAGLVAGLPIQRAGEEAGYTMHKAYRLAQKPIIETELARQLHRRLIMDCAPAALELLKKTVDHGVRQVDAGKEPSRVHIDAAKTLLDRTGLVAQQGGRSGEEKSLGEMTGDELRARFDSMQRELANRATTVIEGDSAPVDAPTDQQVIDILG